MLIPGSGWQLVGVAKTQYFKEWRKFRGLTQEVVSGRTGLDNTIISRLENGKIGYQQSHLEALAHAYACEPADLLRMPPQPDRPESEFERFKRILDEQQLKQAVEVLKAMFRTAA